MRTTARDQGLRRVSSITRWVAAAGIGVVGAFSVMVAKVHPTSATSASAAAGASQSKANQSSSGSSGFQSGQAPTLSSRSASVVSGAS